MVVKVELNYKSYKLMQTNVVIQSYLNIDSSELIYIVIVIVIDIDIGTM